MQFGAPQLCSRCSDLPEIKARRLREFVPTSEAFEDDEIAAFERQLERTCRPCIMCQMKIDQYLKSQQGTRINPLVQNWKIRVKLVCPQKCLGLTVDIRHLVWLLIMRALEYHKLALLFGALPQDRCTIRSQHL